MRNPYHKPRRAHCLGCGKTFHKMHWMKQHRNLERCGGRFLPPEERELRMSAKLHWQKAEEFGETPDGIYHYKQSLDFDHRANLLRKRRLG